MSSEPYDLVLDAPFGRIGVRCSERSVREVDFLPPDHPLKSPTTPLAHAVAVQVAAYLDDPRQPITLPLGPRGTPFQTRVWEALRAIPSGQVRRYGDLAAQLHSSARAVGGACRRNPLPLLIPCHRVVAGDGLGGFSGAVGGQPLAVKRWLLAHEGVLPRELDL